MNKLWLAFRWMYAITTFPYGWIKWQIIERKSLSGYRYPGFGIDYSKCDIKICSRERWWSLLLWLAIVVGYPIILVIGTIGRIIETPHTIWVKYQWGIKDRTYTYSYGKFIKTQQYGTRAVYVPDWLARQKPVLSKPSNWNVRRSEILESPPKWEMWLEEILGRILFRFALIFVYSIVLLDYCIEFIKHAGGSKW